MFQRFCNTESVLILVSFQLRSTNETNCIRLFASTKVKKSQIRFVFAKNILYDTCITIIMSLFFAKFSSIIYDKHGCKTSHMTFHLTRRFPVFFKHIFLVNVSPACGNRPFFSYIWKWFGVEIMFCRFRCFVLNVFFSFPRLHFVRYEMCLVFVFVGVFLRMLLMIMNFVFIFALYIEFIASMCQRANKTKKRPNCLRDTIWFSSIYSNAYKMKKTRMDFFLSYC